MHEPRVADPEDLRAYSDQLRKATREQMPDIPKLSMVDVRPVGLSDATRREAAGLSVRARWEYIADNIAELMAEGDRAGRGLAPLRLHQLPQAEQEGYHRAALAAIVPFAAPELLTQARDAATIRACEVWEGDHGDLVTRATARRMLRAFIHGLAIYRNALDGTMRPEHVIARASTLTLALEDRR